MRPLWWIPVALCFAQAARAQGVAVLHGKVVDSTGTGVSAHVSIVASTDSTRVIAGGATAADGSFAIALSVLPARIVVTARTSAGLSGRLELDSAFVRGSSARPVIVRMGRGGTPTLQRVEVRAHFQRRPAIFNFFESEPGTHVERAGPETTEWLDPFAVGGVAALIRAAPELLVTSDGGGSAMGAPGSSNQLQIGGVRVPNGLVSGQLNGTLSVSPWDITIGGAAGATVNLFVSPGSRYRNSYAVVRSGVGGVPGWTGSSAAAPGVSIPVQLSASTAGPLGRVTYHADVFLSSDVTNVQRWDRTLDNETRGVLDSLSTVLGAPTLRTSERNVQSGIIGRVDLLPGDDKRVLAITSALTRSKRTSGTGNRFVTGSVGADVVDDVGLLQLESTRVVGERVLWTSLLSTSWTRNDVDPAVVAPTIIATDANSGTVLTTGGAPPQPASNVFAAEARSTATWYSVNNRIRYVAQLQARMERAHMGVRDPHATFITGSVEALSNGEALAFVRESGTPAASARSFVLAPAASARIDIGRHGSLVLGARADAWTTDGVVATGSLRHVDVSPRVAFLRRLGMRSAGRGPIATLRVGAGRFTDWPNVQQWSDAWSGAGAYREVCVGADVPSVVLTGPAPTCAGNGRIQFIGRPVAGDDLRPAAANRADVSIALAQIASGVRAEFGASLAQTTRMSARLSPLVSAPVIDRLSGESDRALLVPTADIDANGVVHIATVPTGQPDGTRLISEARSTAAQWRVKLATRDPFARVKLTGVYTLTTGHERSLTIASPTGAPGFVSGPLSAGGRHTFAFSAGGWIGDAEFRFSGLVRSGVRFTPLADRDLNGDGLINDAAYVPQSESDAWARAVSPSVRSCVRDAAGHIAAVNGCTGPWSVSSLFLASTPANRFGMRRGSTIEVQVSNPLAAIAGAMGQTRVVFGDVAMVDPVLVHVTRFDASAQRFRGEPLARFGRSLGLSPTITDPVRVAVGIRIPLGPSIVSQRATVALSTLQRDTSARARQRATMQYLGDIPPIPMIVLQSGEAIQLTADQRSALQALGARWQRDAARIVADAFADDGEVSRRVDARECLVQARGDFLAQVLDIAAGIRRVLSADQIDLLPEGVQRLLNPRFLRFLATQDAATAG